MRRHRKSRSPLHYPHALEHEYLKAIWPVVELCHEAMAKIVIPALPTRLPVTGPHMDAKFDITALGRAGVRKVVTSYSERSLKDVIRYHAGKVDEFQYKQLKRRLVKQSTVRNLTGGLLAPAASEAIIDDFVEENVSLIGSIAADYFGSVENKIKNAVESGMRVEDLAKDLMGTYGVAESKANLIARDQIGKLYGGLNETRQTAVGIQTYIWRTMMDPRVRDTHEELEDTVQAWADPPVTNDDGDTNHPGEDYQCRCTAEPNLEELEQD